jgi:hypothetical protein
LGSSNIQLLALLLVVAPTREIKLWILGDNSKMMMINTIETSIFKMREQVVDPMCNPIQIGIKAIITVKRDQLSLERMKRKKKVSTKILSMLIVVVEEAMLLINLKMSVELKTNTKKMKVKRMKTLKMKTMVVKSEKVSMKDLH